MSKNKIRMFCNESYATEMLEMYNNHTSEFTSLTEGGNYKGEIISISDNEMTIDVGSKQLIYVNLDKEKLDISKYVPGDEISVMVINDPQKDVYVKGSITKIFLNNLRDEMINWDGRTVYTAFVESLDNNGYKLDIQGLKVFMPGSMGGINKLADFTVLLKKYIQVLPIPNTNNYSKFKNELIVSHKEYLKTLIPNELAKLQIGSSYYGKITGANKVGVFVEFNDVLTGLIYKSDLDDICTDLYEKNQLTPGVEIEFYVKDIQGEKIILSRNEVDPANDKKYRPGDILKGVVIKNVAYGSFIEIDKGVMGMIHKSNFKNGIQPSEKSNVSVKILEMNLEKIDLVEL